MELRDRLVLALDVDDIVAAGRMAKELQSWFGTVKVGLELYTACGPDAIASFLDMGFQVFLDLKLHDIPTTVRRAARVIGGLGVRYLTLHAQGGAVMMRSGVDGLAEGAEAGGFMSPSALAVTVLTSDANAPGHILSQRMVPAAEAGCGGFVCSSADVREVKQLAPRLIVVVPGIRMPEGEVHDQARAASPVDAIAAGADLLVIGRTVTAASDRTAAAEALVASLA